MTLKEQYEMVGMGAQYAEMVEALDRQQRERQVAALERIAKALETLAAPPRRMRGV